MPTEFSVPNSVLDAYALEGAEIELLTGGRTNRTLRVRAGRDLVLQQMMQHGNDDLLGIMENLVRVTSHLRWRDRVAGNGESWYPVLVPTVADKPFLMTDTGDVWRAFTYRQGQIVRSVQPRATLASAAALYGRFAAATLDLGGPDLIETAPGFHDLETVYACLMTDLEHAPAVRRRALDPHRDAIDTLRQQLERAAVDDGLGAIRKRVVHNDTKLSNVLFDRDKGRAVAVLDLDLVMMGPCWHDVGDLLRSTAWHDAVDRQPGFCVDLFRAVVDAYVRGGQGTIGSDEIVTFAVAGPRLSLELGLRYLNDHLRDVAHLRVDGIDGHLRRGLANLKLAQEMFAAYDALRLEVDSIGRALAPHPEGTR